MSHIIKVVTRVFPFSVVILPVEEVDFRGGTAGATSVHGSFSARKAFRTSTKHDDYWMSGNFTGWVAL